MPVTDNLISYWKLDEANGLRADAHGGNPLTDNGTVLAGAAIINNGAIFLAAGLEYLSHADNADLSFGDEDFSIAGWFYPYGKTAQQYYVTKQKNAGSANREYSLIYHLGSDRFRFLVSDGANTSTVTANVHGSPTASAWAYIVAYHDSVNNLVGISVNAGVPNTVANAANGCQDLNSPFEMGRVDSAGAPTYSTHKADEVGLWGRILTSANRTWLYNGGAGRAYDDMDSGPIGGPRWFF